jgi:DNA-binding beta-propeller fold protein YncE
MSSATNLNGNLTHGNQTYYNINNTKFPVNLRNVPISLGPACYTLDSKEMKELGCGSVTTLAGIPGTNTQGRSDGSSDEAQFNTLFGIDISPDGSFALVADSFNHKLRHITIASGRTYSLVGSGKVGNYDGAGIKATLSRPSDISISPDGNFALFTDLFNHRVRRVDLASSQVSTICGSIQGSADGIGSIALFNRPFGVAMAPTGEFALISDQKNNKVRYINLANNKVSTFFGSGAVGNADGYGTASSFNSPRGVTISPDGSFALVADTYNHRIRRLNLRAEEKDDDNVLAGFVTTLAGAGEGKNDGIGSMAQFNLPHGVSIASNGEYAVVVDTNNHNIRLVSLESSNGAVTTLCGTGRKGTHDQPEQGGFVSDGDYQLNARLPGSFTYPSDVAISPDGMFSLVADGSNAVRVLSLHSNTFLAVNGASCYSLSFMSICVAFSMLLHAPFL